MALWNNKKEETGIKKTFEGECVPKFGTYCRTAAFEQRPLPKEDGSFATELGWTEYHEAFQPAGSLLWSINKVKLTEENGEKFITTRLQRSDMTFMTALQKLVEYEAFQKELYPDQDKSAQVKGLGLKHYKAFATREGILWNEISKVDEPLTMIHEEALPHGKFKQSAVDEARQIVEAKEKLPEPAIETETDVLTAVFNNAAAAGNIDLALKGLNQASLLESFRKQLSDFEINLAKIINGNPTQTCESRNLHIPAKLCNRSARLLLKEEYRYSQYSYETAYTLHTMRWFGYAVRDLDLANEHLTKLEKTGQDIKPLKKLLLIFEMATHLVYAKKLFKYCQANPAQAEKESGNIKTALNDAEMILTQHLDQHLRELFETLKQDVSSNNPLQIPAIIPNFQKTYLEAKEQSLTSGGMKP